MVFSALKVAFRIRTLAPITHVVILYIQSGGDGIFSQKCFNFNMCLSCWTATRN